MATDKQNKKKGKIKVEQISIGVFLGDVVSSAFFSRNKFTIMILMALMLFYISIKYECQTRMETIGRLQTQLAIVKSEGIREQSLYMSRTRESMMQQLVDTMHLNLGIQNQPPYRLSYDEE